VGSRLIADAEQAARGEGCIGAWLDTFSFQARGFYEKQGYRVVGEIPDHPVGGARYFLSKLFA
jgi:GNAT superfamily N-acetyltransferase